MHSGPYVDNMAFYIGYELHHKLPCLGPEQVYHNRPCASTAALPLAFSACAIPTYRLMRCISSNSLVLLLTPLDCLWLGAVVLLAAPGALLGLCPPLEPGRLEARGFDCRGLQGWATRSPDPKPGDSIGASNEVLRRLVDRCLRLPSACLSAGRLHGAAQSREHPDLGLAAATGLFLSWQAARSC